MPPAPGFPGAGPTSAGPVWAARRPAPACPVALLGSGSSAPPRRPACPAGPVGPAWPARPISAARPPGVDEPPGADRPGGLVGRPWSPGGGNALPGMARGGGPLAGVPFWPPHGDHGGWAPAPVPLVRVPAPIVGEDAAVEDAAGEDAAVEDPAG